MDLFALTLILQMSKTFCKVEQAFWLYEVLLTGIPLHLLILVCSYTQMHLYSSLRNARKKQCFHKL